MFLGKIRPGFSYLVLPFDHMNSASFESILRSPILVEKVCQQLAAMLRADPGHEAKLPAERDFDRDS
jgi:hypothetical protein